MTRKQIDLNGAWRLIGRMEDGGAPRCFTDGEITLDARVPGNIEAELFAAGLVGDPYVGTNARQLRKYEFYEWLFTREFTCDAPVGSRAELTFDGLDCCGTVWINGERAGEAANALIPHTFEVGRLLKPGRNTVAVHLASANNVFRKYPLEASTLSAYPFNYEVTRIRKPAHVWGWDITPRMALGGIFRDVRLEFPSDWRILDDILQVEGLDGKAARVNYCCRIETPEYSFEDLGLVLEGRCGDSAWRRESAVWSAQTMLRFRIEDVRLWWPRHYGSPDLYEVSARLVRRSTGEVLAEHCFTAGIREIRLKANPVWTDGEEPDFQFIVNGVPVKVLGCNHVPLDALHSRDAERTGALLDMACDLECNMLRIWGGGIYESDAFYDRCDREGIMLWHDFMMGCAVYPQDADFQETVRKEAEAVLRRLRQHPCIALWAGDNECDCCAEWGVPMDPERNLLTRRVLPEVCFRLDPSRAYLPSSPWYSPEAMKRAGDAPQRAMEFAAEQHLWGPRDYFKSDFYRLSRASFVSEIGYHGCPDVSSIRRFVPPEKVWPWQDNEQWDYHASNPYLPDDQYLNYRTSLMAEQIREMFGEIPDNLEDFAFASQICQAEAKKFFIELARSRKKISGMLWWNLCDCWPQFSDAVVDYYYGRKLAYYYIRRLQRPLLLMVSDAADWEQRVLAGNIGRRDISGRYRVWDADTDEVFAEGEFLSPAGRTVELARRKVCTTARRMLLIEWETSDGIRGVNHALCGHPQFSLSEYRGWLAKIAALDGSFDAGKAAR